MAQEWKAGASTIPPVQKAPHAFSIILRYAAAGVTWHRPRTLAAAHALLAELPAAALAELNDELAALAKRDGYDGPVAKMPAKVAA